MKKNRLKTAQVIGVIVIAVLAVAAGFLLQRTAPAAEEKSDAGRYLEAVDNMLASGGYRLHIATTKKTTAAERTFTESTEQILSCTDLGSENARIQLEETVSHDRYSFSVSELYENGNAYVALDNGHFTSAITQQDYLKRQVPLKLMDPALYGFVGTERIGDRTAVGFDDASGGESWAVPEGAQLHQACGRVILDADNEMKSASYSVSYQYGSAEVTLQVDTWVEPVTELQISAPEVPESYIHVDHLDIPRLLEHASGYLQQTDTIASQKQETIFSQLGNLRREQTTDLTMEQKDTEPYIEINTEVNLTDYNQGSLSRKTSQKEVFEKGVYSISTQDASSEPEQNPQITADSMILYVQNVLVGTIIMPEHITDISVQQQEGAYVLRFQGSEGLAQYIQTESCQILFEDPELLSRMASSYQTNTLQCTLEIDAATGLPLSSGIEYVGTHVIDDTPYRLESSMSQTYDFLG